MNDILIIQSQNPLIFKAKGCVIVQLDMFSKVTFIPLTGWHSRNRILFRSKFLQKPLDISTSNFYWMIERSKLQSNVLLIFCDSPYFIFNKL